MFKIKNIYFMWMNVLPECLWMYQMWVPEDGIIGIVELELQICGCWACAQVLSLQEQQVV